MGNVRTYITGCLAGGLFAWSAVATSDAMAQGYSSARTQTPQPRRGYYQQHAPSRAERSIATTVQQRNYSILDRTDVRPASYSRSENREDPPQRYSASPPKTFAPARQLPPRQAQLPADLMRYNRTARWPAKSRGPQSFDPISSQQENDLFGEGQAPEEKPSAAPEANDGVVLPPDIFPQKTPKIPGGDRLMPDLRPSQLLPRPNAPEGSNDARQQREQQRIERERKERKQIEQMRRERDRMEEIAPDAPTDSELFDPGDPRHPNANNGPDSWYRPGNNNSQQGMRNPLPAPSGPYGFSTSQVYDPGYSAQPSHQHQLPAVDQNFGAIQGYPAVNGYDPHAYPTQIYDGVMHDGQLLPTQTENSYCDPCSGRPSARTGGCNSCGTGIVNGCCAPMFYLSIFGGYADTEAIEITDTIGSSRYEVEDGYGLGIAFGQFQGRNLRTEIEFSYRDNELSQLTLIGNPAFTDANLSSNGNLRSYSGMANAVWEFVEFPTRRVKPYVGAGFGFSNVEAEASIGTGNLFEEDSDSSFAFQVFGGLNYHVSRTVDLFAEYRYLKADSLQLETNGLGDLPPNGSGDFTYETNNFFAGLRMKF